MKSSLNSLVYIKLPKDYLEKNLSAFDSEIPLPVQLTGSSPKEFDYSMLTPEMILAGMLTVFAYDRENRDIDYFRKIFNLLRPGIKKEMTEAAIIKIKNGDYETGEEILLSLLGLNPDDLVTKFNLAVLTEERAHYFYSINDFDQFKFYDEKAFTLYNELICAEPPFPPAFFDAAFFFVKKGDYRKAKYLFETYILIETGTEDGIKIKLDKAKEIIKWISKQSVDDTLFKEAFDLVNNSEEDKALEKIKEFIVRCPKVWNGWFLLGWALRKLKRWEDGKNAFLKSLEFFDEEKEVFQGAFSDICNELAICFTQLGEFSKAENILMKAVSKDTENIKLLSNMGTVALKSGDISKAEAFFRTVLLLNPKDPIALNVLKR